MKKHSLRYRWHVFKWFWRGRPYNPFARRPPGVPVVTAPWFYYVIRFVLSPLYFHLVVAAEIRNFAPDPHFTLDHFVEQHTPRAMWYSMGLIVYYIVGMCGVVWLYQRYL